MTVTCHLRLFVRGRTPQAHRAVDALRRIHQRVEASGIAVRVEVIDVAEDPQAAEDARILATPTLVRESPPPARRVIGDLSDTALAMAALDLEGLEGVAGDLARGV